MEKVKTQHRHKWESGDYSCWSCGAYTEVCTKEGCYAIKYVDENGKSNIDE